MEDSVGNARWRELHGADLIDEILWIDQAPGGKSSRSNPVTYIKAFDDIRSLLAESPEAKLHNLEPGSFSFNVDGGRCSNCQGAGRIEIDMHFLPNINVRCQDCQGTRYRSEVLQVTYRGKNVAEILGLSAEDAFSFFRGQPRIQARLRPLLDVGIGYLRLGQGADTLSNGEWQRLRLARQLAGKPQQRSIKLLVLDEPSAGLHAADSNKLVECLDALLDVGHSVILVEHNLRLIAAADWVIDLGPGAGEAGGTVLAAGPPEKIAACNESATGQWMRQLLANEN